jgi:hypothetical protein
MYLQCIFSNEFVKRKCLCCSKLIMHWELGHVYQTTISHAKFPWCKILMLLCGIDSNVKPRSENEPVYSPLTGLPVSRNPNPRRPLDKETSGKALQRFKYDMALYTRINLALFQDCKKTCYPLSVY